jgi:endo-1,4-beta-xylanase
MSSIPMAPVASMRSNGPARVTSPVARAGPSVQRGKPLLFRCFPCIAHMHLLLSNINFNAQYYPGNQGGGGSLAVYGWTTNPLIEYYIMENYPSPPTSGLTFVGTVTSDGSNYNIYKHQQVNQPSIVSSSSTFEQYISIRQSPRSSGTVTTGTHFNAWASHGMNLGAWNVQYVSTEAYGGGQGASTVTVS